MKGLCAKRTTIAIVFNGHDYWIGTNECSNPQEICPRKNMKPSEGYELCKIICGQKAHAEVNALEKAGENAIGADLYLIGHYYICDWCKESIKKYGIRNTIICKR